MVRACKPPAREPASAWLGRRSTMATSIPASASSPASISPVGPPPAITTACSVIAARASGDPGSAAHHKGAAPRPGRLRRLRPDRHGQLTDALDLAFELVAGAQRTDAGGRAGHDDVARRERDHLGQLPDDFRHVPDHLLEIAVLL